MTDGNGALVASGAGLGTAAPAIPQPGSSFPKLVFPTVTVKVMIAVTFVCTGPQDAETAEQAVDEVLAALTGAGGNVAVNYERLP